MNDGKELVLSSQTKALWERRERELYAWAKRDKRKKKDKHTVMLESFMVDAELYPVLSQLRRMQMTTEFSCAGVSLQDDPLDHSLYAYITLHTSEQTEAFVRFAAGYMKHRLLVSYEPARKRYDLSSFFIGHNRSFCLLMQRCTELYEQALTAKS
ncbi:hypothetical protein [Paenibacillus sp. Soil522]|uniref:hypothetical protein n=1 Tax=Paenibacillus sp. Soil522 TaxID=1736388 RepID=UPI000A960833